MRAITLALGLLAATLVAAPSGQIPGASASPEQTLTSRFLDGPVEPLIEFRAVLDPSHTTSVQ